MHGDHLLVTCHWAGQFDVVDIYANLPAAVTDRVAGARAVDQNTTHRLGCRGEEVRAILPRRLVVGPEAHPRFMDKRRRLESVLGRLVRQLGCGYAAEFGVGVVEQVGAGGRRLGA